MIFSMFYSDVANLMSLICYWHRFIEKACYADLRYLDLLKLVKSIYADLGYQDLQ